MEAVAELEPEVVQESVAVEEPAADAPDYVREHYDAIREKEREVRVMEGEYQDAKEAASEAKRDFEAADKALRNLIARGPDPQKPLAFTDEPEAPKAADAWRAAPFADLHLTEKQNELFAGVGVTTIGGLEDLRAQIAEGKAEWPKGIGPAKVTDIENRVIDWLDANRDKFGEEAAAEVEPKHGEITSLTFSSVGHESVTITPKQFEKLADNLKKNKLA